MKNFRKKEEFIQKFVEVMGEKRTNVAFHEAVQKTLEELDAQEGVYILDITVTDFEDSDINGARALKIANYVNESRKLSAGMIRDFLLVAGVAEVKRLDTENFPAGTRRTGDFTRPNFRLTQYNINRLHERAEREGRSVSAVIEDAVKEYFRQ